MPHLVALTAFLIVSLSSSVGSTQNQRSNIDYYTVHQDPVAGHLLRKADDFHTNKVVERIREGRIGLATEDLKYTLNYFPNHPKALLLLGSVAQLTNTPMLPIPYYEKALKLFPQHAITHAQYGAYLVDLGRFEEGIAKLQYAVEMNPGLAVAYSWLADAYAKKGNRQLAYQAAERAKELGYRGKLPERLQSSKSR